MPSSIAKPPPFVGIMYPPSPISSHAQITARLSGAVPLFSVIHLYEFGIWSRKALPTVLVAFAVEAYARTSDILPHRRFLPGYG